MEDGSSSPAAVSPSSDPNPTATNNASKLLTNLPSRGLFSSTFSSSNLGGMRVYICDHETAPPENQVIKTDQMNILIRSLTLKKQTDGSRKRSSERSGEGRALAKRAMTTATNGSHQIADESSSCGADRDFQGLKVERLRALLKEKGLSTKGKKDELIARLRNASK